MCTACRCRKGWELELWRSGGHFIYADGFHPFGGDGVTLRHCHACVGKEHLWPTAAAPCEKAEEMVFADGSRAGRSIRFR